MKCRMSTRATARGRAIRPPMRYQQTAVVPRCSVKTVWKTRALRHRAASPRCDASVLDAHHATKSFLPPQRPRRRRRLGPPALRARWLTLGLALSDLAAVPEHHAVGGAGHCGPMAPSRLRLYRRWRARSGRPSVDREVRDLIRQMSKTNPLWGAPRINGELLKLAIEVSEATVAKYMVR
jgi:hypothetical protein